jgi:hypothetical protein
MSLTQQDIDNWNQYAQANPIPTFGPIIAGPCVDTLLLGVILCEVVYYRLRMERADRWYMKLLVVSPQLPRLTSGIPFSCSGSVGS